MDPKRIYSANNSLTEEDLLELAKLLIKAGYTVKKSKQALKNGKEVRCIIFGTDMEEIESGK